MPVMPCSQPSKSWSLSSVYSEIKWWKASTSALERRSKNGSMGRIWCLSLWCQWCLPSLSPYPVLSRLPFLTFWSSKLGGCPQPSYRLAGSLLILAMQASLMPHSVVCLLPNLRGPSPVFSNTNATLFVWSFRHVSLFDAVYASFCVCFAPASKSKPGA